MLVDWGMLQLPSDIYYSMLRSMSKNQHRTSVVLKTSYRYNVPTRYMYHPTAHHKVLFTVLCARNQCSAQD
jgi:hypothetical protein